MSNTQWDFETDVLVVGSGKGALTAALSAYEMGCTDVLVIEKDEKFGDTSALSGGASRTRSRKHALGCGNALDAPGVVVHDHHAYPASLRRDCSSSKKRCRAVASSTGAGSASSMNRKITSH